jgi:hypothetical protein
MDSAVTLQACIGKGEFAHAFHVVRQGAEAGAPPIAVAKIFYNLDRDPIRLHFEKERIALEALSYGTNGHACLIGLLRAYADREKKQGVLFLELGPRDTLGVRSSLPSAWRSSSPPRRCISRTGQGQ